MHAKDADVVKTEEVLTWFAGLPKDMFDRPAGKPRSRPSKA
jgi:hypothetical protein